MGATTVGTRELKNRLSYYLRRVKTGEALVITERGKPVGQIIPIQSDLAGRLRKLAEAGVVDWNGQPQPGYRPAAVNRSQKLMSDLVSEERE